MADTESPPSRSALYLEQCREAMRQIVGFLGGMPDANATLAQLYAAYDERRQALGGWKAVGIALGLPEKHADEIVNKCNTALRLAKALEPVLADAAPSSAPDHELLLLRTLRRLERLTENKPEVGVQFRLPAPDNARLVRSQQQVRALELVIRSLVSTSYDSEENLRVELTNWLGSEQVEKWLATADTGDLLSGTSFGELAGLFINKKQYPNRYEHYYKDTPYLKLLESQRATLADFLEDIRIIRNQIAHNKRISAVQVALLGAYYEQVITPVQQAHDRSNQGVNPDRYFDVGSAELDDYFEDVRKRLDTLGDKVVNVLEDVREIDRKVTAVHGTVKEVQGTVQETQDRVVKIGVDTVGTRKRLKWVLGGIAVLAVAALATLYLSAGAKRETSGDPRKELANRGLTWRPEELRGVIDNGDADSARLFFEGGMKWPVHYAFKALDRDDKPMLALLADYPKLLTRGSDGCSSLMSHLTRTEPGTQKSEDRGVSAQPQRLKPAERDMLKLVCNTPEDVKLAKEEFAKADGFYRSQLDAYNKEKAAVVPVAQCTAELAKDNYSALLDEVSHFNIMSVRTLAGRDVLLADLYPGMASGLLSPQIVSRAVEKYCKSQAAEEPNIDISESHRLAKKQILDVLN